MRRLLHLSLVQCDHSTAASHHRPTHPMLLFVFPSIVCFCSFQDHFPEDNPNTAAARSSPLFAMQWHRISMMASHTKRIGPRRFTFHIFSLSISLFVVLCCAVQSWTRHTTFVSVALVSLELVVPCWAGVAGL